ncbi:helix-turn-helix transcriptional regulator [Sulfitobacter sp. PR48]|uniref:helix-turn-helix domain-containing protein n=1 Tax=Sulfitobacter sp. PR48 TaxID=3028383 RepID=UPI00237A546C|nr:helix-turn-helix transcriptional regulator [Sulfitobacter sp. PR48]MDD9720307.1 helix-turn-helix transcriptional regulator [Sulfitobacter sp. PR48]
MDFSPTAQMLAKAIKDSGLSHRDIADQVGFKHPNILTMMEQGLFKVPLDRVPALSQALGLDQTRFLLVAIEDYHTGVYEVLCDTLGLPFSDAEQGLVMLFRMASLRNEIEFDGPFRKALEGLLELAEAATMR